LDEVAVGVAHCATAPVIVGLSVPSFRPWSRWYWLPCAAAAVIVGHCCAGNSTSPIRLPLRLVPPPLDKSVGVCHSEDKQPLPLVARADFSRREQSARNAVAKALQIPKDFSSAKPDMPCHVFCEHDAGHNALNRSTHRWPKVPRIAVAKSFAGR
jgi:hypothetical protein